MDEAFDLDMSYITERIIAMSFPSKGLEATYRNNLNDVARMLKMKHKDSYMVFNVSERSYDVSKLNNQVRQSDCLKKRSKCLKKQIRYQPFVCTGRRGKLPSCVKNGEITAAAFCSVGWVLYVQRPVLPLGAVGKVGKN